MHQVYAVLVIKPTEIGDQAHAIFAHLQDALNYIESHKDGSRLCIEIWEVSNIDFMRIA